MASKIVNGQEQKLRPDLEVIAQAPCAEAVAMASMLLDSALSGRVFGFGLVALQRHGDFFVDMAGEASRDPVRTRGMVRSLDEHVGDWFAAMSRSTKARPPMVNSRAIVHRSAIVQTLVAFSIAAVFAGCASLSEEGSKVRVITGPEKQGCTFLKLVTVRASLGPDKTG